MTQTKIILSGSIAIDRIMGFDGLFSEKILPDKIDVLSVSILMDSLEITNGGVAGNMSYSAARMGLEPILLGSVGSDGRSYMQNLESEGVNISYIHESTTPTAAFSVFTDKEHNQVGGFFPGAMADAASLALEPWYGADAIVCISASDPDAMRRQVRECAENKIRLMYDPGQQTNNISGDDLLAGCHAAEIIVVNEYELSILSDKTGIAESDLKQIPRIFITTKGKSGSEIAGSSLNDAVTIPAATPEKIIDPTGAGDCYRVGLLYGIVHDWDIEKCARLASVMASFVVESSKPVARLDVKMVENRYEHEFNMEISLG